MKCWSDYVLAYRSLFVRYLIVEANRLWVSLECVIEWLLRVPSAYPYSTTIITQLVIDIATPKSIIMPKGGCVMAGGFSEKLIEKAWVRSGGKCECELTGHGHTGRHNTILLKNFLGNRDSSYGWETHSVSGLHLDILSDCKIFCWNPCHKETL